MKNSAMMTMAPRSSERRERQQEDLERGRHAASASDSAPSANDVGRGRDGQPRSRPGWPMSPAVDQRRCRHAADRGDRGRDDLVDDRLPSSTSRFSSRPTRKKKIAIRPSLIQSNAGLLSPRAPNATVNFVSRSPRRAAGAVLVVRRGGEGGGDDTGRGPPSCRGAAAPAGGSSSLRANGRGRRSWPFTPWLGPTSRSSAAGLSSQISRPARGRNAIPIAAFISRNVRCATRLYVSPSFRERSRRWWRRSSSTAGARASCPP